MTRALLLGALLAACLAAQTAGPATDRLTRPFFVLSRGNESQLRVLAGCAGCNWGADGREAAVLRVSIDGVYSQHVVLARGETPVEYRVALGSLAAGPHELTIERDAALSARDAGPATIDVQFGDVTPRPTGEYLADALSPILYARANTIGRFTDLPLVMWYEIVPTARGRQYRYSVIFSNEDGGTPTDRLMATWGRTTDIEYVYGVEVDREGRTLAEEFQGPGHEVPAFTGRHEARHPLLWVSTDNNMVSESGSTEVRYALVAEPFDLAAAATSREEVMDAHPWLYALMSQELAREGKIVADAPPGRGVISDPRQFVYVEACGEVGNAALAFEIGVRAPPSETDRAAAVEWIPSDRGRRDYRIVRDGCFRSATPLPAGRSVDDLRGLRVRAYQRSAGDTDVGSAAARVRLTRINRVFMLDDHYLPLSPKLVWLGSVVIEANGAPFEREIPMR